MAMPEAMASRLRGMLGTESKGPVQLHQRYQGLSEPYRPDPRTSRIISMVNTKLQRYQRDRYEFERVWFSNIAIFLGFQYHTFAAHATRLVAPAIPAHRVRLVCNRFFAHALGRIAKFTRSRPIVNVIPHTSDDEDFAKARACEKFLRYLDEPNELDEDETGQERRIMLASWMTLCGSSFVQVNWDPNLGDFVERPRMRVEQVINQDGFPENVTEPVIDESGAPVVDSYYVGDVSSPIISPFEFYPSPGARTMGKLADFVIARFIPVEQARLAYPEFAHFIHPSQDWSLSQFFRQRIGGLVGLGRYSSGASHSEDFDGVMMKEYHERPSTAYKKGRVIILAGDVKVDENTDPKLGWCNVVKFGDTYVPGRFWDETPMTQCVPIQKGYNRGRSQIKEYKNLIAVLKIMAAKNHGIEDAAWDSEHGEFIEYNPQPGVKEPFILQVPNLPEASFRDMEYDLDDMRNISGVNEVSLGINPPNVESGLQLQYLAEMDDTKFAAPVARYETSMARVARLQLQAARLGYSEDRMLTVLGENNKYEVFNFSRDLMPLRYSVRVQVGSALPESKAARIDKVMTMWREGLIVDPYTRQPDHREAMRMMDFGDYERYLEEKRQDEKNADMEHANLKQGQFEKIRVVSFDDHNVHITEHNKERKKDWYRDLPPGHPIKMFFDFHVNTHHAAQAMIMWQQAQQQADMLLASGLNGEIDAEAEAGASEPSTTEREGARQQGGAKGGTKSRVRSKEGTRS